MPIPLSNPITITGLPTQTPTPDAVLPFDNAGASQTGKGTILSVLNSTSFLFLSSTGSSIGDGTNVLEVGNTVTFNGSPLAGLWGTTDPGGSVSANPGTSFVNVSAGSLWFKLSAADATGWQKFIQL